MVESTMTPFLSVEKNKHVLYWQEGQLPFTIDFHAQFKRAKSQGKEMLYRAVGEKKNTDITLIDATAGLGRDAFMLASFGWEVILIEKNPLLQVLLKEALENAKNDVLLGPIAHRMQLYSGDALTIIPQLTADIIYCDPMYQLPKLTAQVKKEAQILQLLSGKENSAGLLGMARMHAKKRVIVKRALHAETFEHTEPNFSLNGKTTRIDVYLPL